MKFALKLSVFAALAAGLATVTNAQQSGDQRRQSRPDQPRAGGDMMGEMGTMGPGMMMDDPRLQTEMIEMMRACRRMMETMSSMPMGSSPRRR